MIGKVPTSIEHYTKLVEERTPFTLSNVGGDGEFLTMLGWTGTNSDGHTSTPEKGAALARCVLEPRSTYHGYNPGTPGSDKQKNAEAWLRAKGVNVPVYHPTHIEDVDYGRSKVNVPWVHKEIIAAANCQGKIGPFFSALKARNLAIVGGHHLRNMVRILDADAALLLPDHHGWGELDQIERDVRDVLSTISSDGVVTWSLGYLTKVLQWRLIPDYPQLTQIDMGAVFDPYCGLRKRRFYRSDKWPAAEKANLHGMVS